MPKSKFVQIHFIHNYTGALLNRDMTGQAKRLPFGGTIRTRVSSQCIKRHWRTAEGEHSLFNIPGAEESVRSRNIINRMVVDSIRANGNYEDDVLDALQDSLNAAVYGKNGITLEKRQPILLGMPEINYFRAKAEEILAQNPTDPIGVSEAVAKLFNDEDENFRAMWAATQLPAGLIAALCGRMMTSDQMSSMDGSIHVAHVITTHPQESERDYFSVVDELGQSDELGELDEATGSAYLGDTELTSGLFYGYVVVDVPRLVANLQSCSPKEWENADRTMAALTVRTLLHLIAETSPGAKLGSTAPHSRARFMMVETGSTQPCGYHMAFRETLEPQMAATLKALANEISVQDENYGLSNARTFMSLEPDPGIPSAKKLSMDELADWAYKAVLDANVD